MGGLALDEQGGCKHRIVIGMAIANKWLTPRRFISFAGAGHDTGQQFKQSVSQDFDGQW